MKNFLKSAVNVAVILSILITSIPLQAMEESEGDREKRGSPVSKTPSKKRQSKKEPIDFIKRNKEAVKARSVASNPHASSPVSSTVEPKTAKPVEPNVREEQSNKPKIRGPSSSSKNKTEIPPIPMIASTAKVKTPPNKSLREIKSTPSSQQREVHTKIKSIREKGFEEKKGTTRFQSKISSKTEKPVLKNNHEKEKSIVPYYLRTTTTKTKPSPALHSKVKSETTMPRAIDIQEEHKSSSIATISSSPKEKPVRVKKTQETKETRSHQHATSPEDTKPRQKISSEEKKVKIEEERKEEKKQNRSVLEKLKEEQDRLEQLKEEKERKQKKEQFRIVWEERVEALERSLQECTQKEEEERKRLEEEQKRKEVQERIEHERKLKQVEERKQKEEHYRIAYEELKRISERVKQERIQREEEERKLKEEQGRIIHEQKIKEDKSRRKAEEGELKRKFETERKKKEDEDHRRAEEEALKRKQEEERKKAKLRPRFLQIRFDFMGDWALS